MLPHSKIRSAANSTVAVLRCKRRSAQATSVRIDANVALKFPYLAKRVVRVAYLSVRVLRVAYPQLTLKILGVAGSRFLGKLSASAVITIAECGYRVTEHNDSAR